VDAGVLTGLLVVFVVIGALELVDRTSFSLIALAARQSPWRTWVGGALAFVASTAIAVSIGAAFVAAVGAPGIEYLRVGGGSFLIAYALWLWFHEEGEEEPRVRTGHSAIIAAFLATFLLELGDTTMIFQIVFVTTYGWLLVFVAGAGALVTVAAFASFVGGQFGARLEPTTLKKVVVGVLLVVGAVTILYGLAPGYFAGVG
jgi:putative Ca2+/H+ antiporter (TMEM165/GDT1 family)